MRIQSLLPHLDERSRRLYLAAEARAIGHGGVTEVARVAGCARDTLQLGLKELDGQPLADERVRRAGGGRRRLTERNPELVKALHVLVDTETRGDPMSPLRYTSLSTTKLAAALSKAGHHVSADTVGRLLREEGFSLQANAKTREGADHPDRDEQFHHINKRVKAHLKANQPVISVDTKKKELVGNYKNNGREYQPKESPVKVNVHDFPDKVLGKAIPYGVYDVQRNEGWVSVGRDHDTSSFAVETVRTWWKRIGRSAYPNAKKLLICADGGGSNGYRVHLWKRELAQLAAETGLDISVCHLPPGTSKWNKIEHRLFSHITMNWRGRPLTSHETIVDLIGATTTEQGLRVQAALDEADYPKGIKVTKKELAALPITRDAFHGEWNYTITPPKKTD